MENEGEGGRGEESLICIHVHEQNVFKSYILH